MTRTAPPSPIRIAASSFGPADGRAQGSPYRKGGLYRSSVMGRVAPCIFLAAALLMCCGAPGAGGHQSASAPRVASTTFVSPTPQQTPAAVSADPQLLSNTNGSFAFRHPADWQFIN